MNTTHTPVTLQALGTTNVAAAVVTFDGIEGEGDSKRNNGEKRQPQVGMDLAIGRAFQDLGQRLIKRAYDALPPEPELEFSPPETSYFFVPEFGDSMALSFDPVTGTFRVEN